MGCNCGKSTPPAGSQPPPSQHAASSAPAQPISEAAKAAAGTSAPATPVTQQAFALTTTDGRTQTFGSKLEATAEQKRRGGGTIRPVR